MEYYLQKAEERGSEYYGWLKAKFSFSFANYYNPKRMGFGKLLVCNNDIIQPETGFGTHPHANMEIITLPLKGTLTHKDSLGSHDTIQKGQIQVMSAGTGIQHSETNESKTEPVELFQIWISPKTNNTKPRYETKNYTLEKNKLNLLIAEKEAPLTINQEAKMYLAEYDKKTKEKYDLKKGKGMFLMVIQGNLEVEGKKLQEKDSIEIWNTNNITIQTENETKIFLLEVPKQQ